MYYKSFLIIIMINYKQCNNIHIKLKGIIHITFLQVLHTVLIILIYYKYKKYNNKLIWIYDHIPGLKVFFSVNFIWEKGKGQHHWCLTTPISQKARCKLLQLLALIVLWFFTPMFLCFQKLLLLLHMFEIRKNFSFECGGI